MNISEFVSTYAGRVIGWAECVAAFWRFNLDVNKGEAYSAPGACNLWTQGGQAYVWDTYSREAYGQYGDWAIWAGDRGAYPNGGLGHVAMFLRDNGGNGTGQFMSQNPGPFREVTLSYDGILGFLRAKGVEAGQAPGGQLVNRTVTNEVAYVRTAPAAGAPEAPGYAGGLARGSVLAVKGYVAGEDPYGAGDNAWYVTKSGFYVWANAAENSLEGLALL